MPNFPRRLPGASLAVLFAFALIVASFPTAIGAANSKQLRRVKGNVGYQTAESSPYTQIFGKFDLPDDYVAVTEADGLAELSLPDSSIVTLGAGTHVQVGAFNTTADGPGSKIIVNGGTLRFDIKRPAGGRANYTFQTATSQIAVRGTIGLLSFVNGVTTVGCVQCAADSVVVTTGGQTFAIATGQILTVTAAGVAIPGALTATTTAAFGATGVGTGAGAGAGAGAAAGAAAAGAAVAGVAAASIANSNKSTSTPQPLPTATIAPTPTPSPSPTATATGKATSTPSPSPSPSPSSPTPTPTPTLSPAPTGTPTSAGNVNITGNRRGANSGGNAPAAPVPAGATAAPAGARTMPPVLPGMPDAPLHGRR